MDLRALAREAVPEEMRRQGPRKIIAVLLVLVALNVGVLLLPIDYRRLGDLAYAGAFLVALIANAAIALPIPYLPVLARMAMELEHPWLIAALAALGSALGESVPYVIGRTQTTFVTRHPWYPRIAALIADRRRAGLILAALAAPLNPIFDIAGLVAGTIGMPFPLFFVAVLAGRLVRFGVIVALALMFSFVPGG